MPTDVKAATFATTQFKQVCAELKQYIVLMEQRSLGDLEAELLDELASTIREFEADAAEADEVICADDC